MEATIHKIDPEVDSAVMEEALIETKVKAGKEEELMAEITAKTETTQDTIEAEVKAKVGEKVKTDLEEETEITKV